MNASETWGKKVVLDPLASHFKLFFDSLGLLDIAPTYVGPTWRNGRVGEEGINKRLDRFLLYSSSIPSLKVHHMWIHHVDISDHYPIDLEWNKSIGYFKFPYKFNRSWLTNPEFNLWVTKRWPKLNPQSSFDDMDLFSHKLRTLKKEVNV